MGKILSGWKTSDAWAMVLIDLCFYTGKVTAESDQVTPGMPEGAPGADDPSEYFGLRILQEIQRRAPELPVVVLSSKPREDVSLAFSAFGALGYLPRTGENSPEMLRELIWRHGLLPDEDDDIIGCSTGLLLSLREARRATADRRNILIRGERGTGKELLARYIHRNSSSGAAKPFSVIDSGTLAPALYASELFGYRRGSFTGADRDYPGKIVQADGGDLFLDEIGNMPQDVQIGMLRAIEQKVVTPIGSNDGRVVDVRFLSATNENLEARAASGEFRRDLLDRLSDGGVVILEPLRDRQSDIPLLVEYFVRQAESLRSGALRRAIHPDTITALCSYSWPGNIRELRSILTSAVYNNPDVEHLVPLHLRLPAETRAEGYSPPGKALVSSSGGSPQINRFALSQSFDEASFEDLVGMLPSLESAHSLALLGLLRRALELTRRFSPDAIEGLVMIHPAIKLLTGDRSITASRAADVVKRILSRPGADDIVAASPILRAAREKAYRLRPLRSVLTKARREGHAGE